MRSLTRFALAIPLLAMLGLDTPAAHTPGPVTIVLAADEIVDYGQGRFVISRSGTGTCVVALQGYVTREAAQAFDEVESKTGKDACTDRWLLLESLGGETAEGLWLGREIRARRFRTIARYDCASACATIFLGGTQRVLVGTRARIGLHQPITIRPMTHERHCSTSLESNGVPDIREYLRFVIPEHAEQIMEIVLRTPCDSIEWISGQRAIDLGIATSVEVPRGDARR